MNDQMQQMMEQQIQALPWFYRVVYENQDLFAWIGFLLGVVFFTAVVVCAVYLVKIERHLDDMRSMMFINDKSPARPDPEARYGPLGPSSRP